MRALSTNGRPRGHCGRYAALGLGREVGLPRGEVTPGRRGPDTGQGCTPPECRSVRGRPTRAPAPWPPGGPCPAWSVLRLPRSGPTAPRRLASGRCQPEGWRGKRTVCQHCSASTHVRGLVRLSPRRRGSWQDGCPVRRRRPALRCAGGRGEGGEGALAALLGPQRVLGCREPVQGASCLRGPPLPSVPLLRPPPPLGGGTSEGDLESLRPGAGFRGLISC